MVAAEEHQCNKAHGNTITYIAVAAQEALAAGSSTSEAWLDHPTLQALQQGQPAADVTLEQQYRVRQGLKLYARHLQLQQLLSRMPDGSTRIMLHLTKA